MEFILPFNDEINVSTTLIINSIEEILVALLRKKTGKNFVSCQKIYYSVPSYVIFRPILMKSNFDKTKNRGYTVTSFTLDRDVDRFLESYPDYGTVDKFKYRSAMMDKEFYYPKPEEYGLLLLKFNPKLYINKVYVSNDPLAFYLINNPEIDGRNPEINPLPEEVSLEYSEGILLASLISITDQKLKQIKEISRELNEMCVDFRSVGVFTIDVGEHSDYRLLLELARMFNYKRLDSYPEGTDILVFQGQKKWTNNDQKWMNNSLLYIKNDRYPQLTKRYIISGMENDQEKSDHYLKYAVIDSINRIIDEEPNKRYLLQTLNRLIVKNGYVTIEVPSEEVFESIDSYILEFINQYVQYIMVFKISTNDEDLMLAGRFQLLADYSDVIKVISEVNQNNSYITIDIISDEFFNNLQQRKELIEAISRIFENPQIETYRNGLISYYKETCRQDNDPITAEKFKEMSLSKLAEIIIGYDIQTKGKPFCFSKDTLDRIRPREINPMTRVPFTDETMNQLSMVKLAKNGIFDIGLYPGLFSVEYYDFDISPLKSIPGIIDVDILGDEELLYYLEQADGKRVDLFFSSNELDMANLNNLWEAGKLLSSWAKRYMEKYNLESSYSIDNQMRDMLQTAKAEDYLQNLSPMIR